jgi:hypothetical protein
MALADLAAFRLACPEFVQLSDAQVQDALDKAAASTPDDPWFDYQLEGHTLLAAHLLALSPMGNNARLDGVSETTVYGSRFDRLKMLVGCGTRVI